MNLVKKSRLANSAAELFPPIDSGTLDALLAEHRDWSARLSSVAEVFAGESSRQALDYFAAGNASRHFIPTDLFSLEPALRALDAAYWRKALAASGVLEMLPADRRKEWEDQLEHAVSPQQAKRKKIKPVPPFNESTLRATMREHVGRLQDYFAERVDGVFRALSPDHKTNLPQGFRSKMIIAGVTNGLGSTRQADYLVDLRAVVARFMGRDAPLHVLRRDTTQAVEYARYKRTGEWVVLDGGSIEIRCYKVGTCHVRVHDEIAWRLNAVLAHLHPGAIPESARTRPSKKRRPKKGRELVTRPLPLAVLREIRDFYRGEGQKNMWWYRGLWSDVDKHVRAEVEAVFASLGGAVEGSGRVHFDYDPKASVEELLASGCVPDRKAHQYYPTPEPLAQRAVELADIGPEDKVLEPSAGQGHLAGLLPQERTLCIEASALHCAVLTAKGFDIVEGDFLEVLPSDVGSHTRVVMNPPFDRGQWLDHVEHAASFVAPGGKLVAILPEGAPRKLDLPGWTLTWSEPIEGAFAGTNIAVVLLLAEREG